MFKRILNRVCFHKGIDIYIKDVWCGIHFNWQSIPFFDIINHHRKCNTIHEYGIIIFGLWIYIKIDE
jgi:hypothetical protein